MKAPLACFVFSTYSLCGLRSIINHNSPACSSKRVLFPLILQKSVREVPKIAIPSALKIVGELRSTNSAPPSIIIGTPQVVPVRLSISNINSSSLQPPVIRIKLIRINRFFRFIRSCKYIGYRKLLFYFDKRNVKYDSIANGRLQLFLPFGSFCGYPRYRSGQAGENLSSR